MFSKLKQRVKSVLFRNKEYSLSDWEKKIATKVVVPFKTVLPYLDNHAVVIDIGANVGAFTDKIHERFKDIKIHLFEPVPRYYNRLVEKYNGIPNFSINRLALSDETGFFDIWVDKYNLGFNTMINKKASPEMESIQIETILFDDYAKKYAIDKIDLIKIDVEGAEYKVLKGMKGTLSNLKRKPVIFCEIGWGKDGHPNWKEEVDVFEWLFSIGYKRINYEDIKHTADVLFVPEIL